MSNRAAPAATRAVRWVVLAGGIAAALPAASAATRADFVGATEIGQFGALVVVGDVIPRGEVVPYLIEGDREAITVRDGTAFGVRLARHLSRRWTLEASWSYAFSELRVVAATGSGKVEGTFDGLGIVHYELGTLFYPMWMSGGRVGVFLRAGAGGMGWRPANDFPEEYRPLATNWTAAPVGSAGLGVTYYPTSELALRAEYALSVTRLNRDELLSLEYPFVPIGSRTMTANRFEIGFSLRFFDTEL